MTLKQATNVALHALTHRATTRTITVDTIRNAYRSFAPQLLTWIIAVQLSDLYIRATPTPWSWLVAAPWTWWLVRGVRAPQPTTNDTQDTP